MQVSSSSPALVVVTGAAEYLLEIDWKLLLVVEDGRGKMSSI